MVVFATSSLWAFPYAIVPLVISFGVVQLEIAHAIENVASLRSDVGFQL